MNILKNEESNSTVAVVTATEPVVVAESQNCAIVTATEPVVTDSQAGTVVNDVQDVAAVPATVAPEAAVTTPDSGAAPVFNWDRDESPGSQTTAFCARLAATKAFYRTEAGRISYVGPGGLKPQQIRDAVEFEGAVRMSFQVEILKGGDVVGRSIPATDLKILLNAPALQQEIPVLDLVLETPTFDPQWNLTHPGYNDGQKGGRIYYVGEEVQPKLSQERITEFLAVMNFKTDADRTNAVAYAITVLLRHMWPGRKPFFAITANRSHAGKDTIVDFGAGRTRKDEISWHERDWAVQNEAVAVLADQTIGVLSIGNIRAGSSVIESAFIERIVTSPKALMQSSKMRGPGFAREGDFVVCATANDGKFSPDLANRSVPIHLEQMGNINERKSAIGNPRHEYLPLHRKEIEAELCGMIEVWKQQGRPLDNTVRHPMNEWAAVVGGILNANGFKGFLQNWNQQRNVNDTIREALGILAHHVPHGQKLRVVTILKIANAQGVLENLIEPSYRKARASMERRLGVILSHYDGDSVSYADEDGIHSYTIQKSRTTVAKETDGKATTQATVYTFMPDNKNIKFEADAAA